MTRQEANRELVQFISDMVETYPDLRFNQLIMNCIMSDIDKDYFYEESVLTLDRTRALRKKFNV